MPRVRRAVRPRPSPLRMAAAASRRRARIHPLTVRDLTRLTDDAVAISFAVPDDLKAAFRFTQGQHVALSSPSVPDGVRRSYSICSPATAGDLRIAVRSVPGGAFSTYLNTELRPGDTLDVMTPTGTFHTPLRPTNRKHYAAVAAGSGITPIISIVATTLELEPQSSFVLLYGNRTTHSTMFLEELHDLKNRYQERLMLFLFLSRESREPTIFDGRITPERLAALSKSFGANDVDEWFLCGPIAMLDDLTEALLSTGIERRQIHRELFYAGEPSEPRPPKATDGDGPGSRCLITVTLDGQKTVVEVPGEAQSVLDAVLTVRADAPYACRGGVCGTCRARVTRGRVRASDSYALEPSESEAGFILTCRSYPETGELTIDFDC